MACSAEAAWPAALQALAASAAISLQALDGRREQFLQVAAFCRHKCTATALSTWGMSTYSLAAPPSRVARMEEADEPLLAVKRGRPRIHQLLVHFREERNQGRAWSRATARAEEPINLPLGLGTGRCARLQPRSRGSRESTAVNSGSDSAAAATPEGCSSAESSSSEDDCPSPDAAIDI